MPCVSGLDCPPLSAPGESSCSRHLQLGEVDGAEEGRRGEVLEQVAGAIHQALAVHAVADGVVVQHLREVGGGGKGVGGHGRTGTQGARGGRAQG